MTLVQFGCLSSHRYLKENIKNDIRKVLQDEQFEIMDTDLVPFGMIDNGLNDPFEVDKDGDRWYADRQKAYPFDDFNWRPKL